MILSAITDSVVGKLAEVPLKPAVEFLERYFADRRSFNHARERLRVKYEAAVQPASYDFVAENFHISKQDFIDYFESPHERTAVGLSKFLKARLVERASLWQHNRPLEQVHESMIVDFYEAYFNYYVSNDPQLCGLSAHDVSLEILEKIDDIQQVLKSLQPNRAKPQAIGIFGDILVALKVAGIPYSIIEEAPELGHVDFSLVDPTSLLPANLFASVHQQGVSQSTVEELRLRAVSEGQFTHTALIAADVDIELVEYARRRGVRVFSPEAFVGLFAHPTGLRPFIIGRVGANSLKKSLHIDEAYIQPDVVVTTPGEDMENRYFNERSNSDQFIDEFLKKSKSGVLVVLGNYGAGKSALAAHTLSRLTESTGAVAPAYVPMRDLSSAQDIIAIVRRCVSTLQSVFPGRRQLVIILDGLDEMPNAMDSTERKRNVQALLQAATLGAKIIVMVRVSYFAGLTDFWSFFSTAGESPLWSRFASHLPNAGDRPELQAVVIRDFDSEQIQRYVEGTCSAEVASDYFTKLRANDLDGTYERLQRNPLYLYLILKTRPWEDQSIGCFSDVIEQFINYWLERDVEKGPSRWLLSTLDRKEFVRSIALHLFERNDYIVDVKHFHEYVHQHFSLSPDDQGLASLILDLQTTGIFSIVGNSMTFSLRAYADFFIAKAFSAHETHLLGERLPDAYQTRMWLGLVETTECASWEPFSGEAKKWFSDNVIPNPSGVELQFDPQGILCGPALNVSSRRINSERYAWLREIFRKIFSLARSPAKSTLAPDLADEISDSILVTLRIENKLGLHARASAKLTKAAQAALGVARPLRDNRSETPAIYISHHGRKVNATSIMGVMMLAAGRGAELAVEFNNCRQKQALHFLSLIYASPEQEIDGVWVTQLGELQIKRDRDVVSPPSQTELASDG